MPSGTGAAYLGALCGNVKVCIFSTRCIRDWVLSHWVHFTVHSLDLFVFVSVYFVLLFFVLHICCVIVSTVGWT